ncbi:MAG: hypothetical protein ABIJ09_25830 [Pseudomonadota bacterium]
MVTSDTQLLELKPAQAARELARAASPAWLSGLRRHLAEQGAIDELPRVLAAWGLSQSEAATLFGVSRQALSKWLSRGVPGERLEAVADLAAATDVLCHYLKPERIPAVVRRKAENLQGKSLLDLAGRKRTREVLAACREMFDFSRIHG